MGPSQFYLTKKYEEVNFMVGEEVKNDRRVWEGEEQKGPPGNEETAAGAEGVHAGTPVPSAAPAGCGCSLCARVSGFLCPSTLPHPYCAGSLPLVSIHWELARSRILRS